MASRLLLKFTHWKLGEISFRIVKQNRNYLTRDDGAKFFLTDYGIVFSHGDSFANTGIAIGGNGAIW